MQLQQIRPDFSGSEASMQAAQRGIAQVGTFANEWMDRLAKEKAVATEEQRYQTELARQKVLDNRATQLYNRQEEARKAQLAGEQITTPDIIGARAVGYDASGRAGEQTQAYEAADIQRAAAENKLMQTRIAKDPSLQAKYTQALGDEDFMQVNAQGQMVPMSAADRATTERLTREQVLGKYKPQTGVEALTLALQGNRPVETEQQEQVVPVQTPQGIAYKKVPMGTQVVQEATQGTAGVRGKTPDEFAIEKGLVGNLFGTPGTMYKEGPMTSSRKNKIALEEAKYDKLLAPYQEQMRQSVGMGVTAKNNTSFNTAAKNAETLIAQKESAIKEIMRDKSQPKGTEGIVSRDVWRKANTDERVGIINGAIGNIQDPTKRTALQQEFAKSIKGVAPTEGKKAITKTIYGQVPVLAPGEKISSKNTYNGKVVTTFSGEPVDMSGVPTNARGPIVEAHKGFANKVKDMFSVQDALAVTSKRVLGELAAKHGVTRKEMDVDGILKSAGMDGTMTPQQERQVKMWEGELAGITEQYKLNQTQANADRAYKLQVQQLQNQMSQFALSHSQSERHFQQGRTDRKVELSAFEKARETSLGRASVDESSPKYKQEVDKSIRESIRQQYVDKYGEENFWNPSLSSYMDTGVTKYYTDQANRDKAALMKAKTNK